VLRRDVKYVWTSEGLADCNGTEIGEVACPGVFGELVMVIILRGNERRKSGTEEVCGI